MNVFSIRYKNLLETDYDNFIGKYFMNDNFWIREDLVNIFESFREEFDVTINRYTKATMRTDALESAIEQFEKIFRNLRWSRFSFDNLPTPNYFDIAELQYLELSDSEKVEFAKEINQLFKSKDIPWLMSEGQIIKIDNSMFEMDLKNKALEQTKELKTIDSRFQSAYNELKTAYEFYEKGNYAEAISNAEKSYESMLKIINGLDRGNANKLTEEYVKLNGCQLPNTMKASGFKDSVMMSLPFIRNNSSSDHGAGAESVVISKALANLAINLACSLNTYLIDEFKITNQDE